MPKSAGNSNVEKLQTGEAQFLILLVGINQYDDPRIKNLNYCVNDCQELKVALESATQLFTNKNIIIHHDNTPESPLLDVVKNSLEKLVAQATKEDIILIYFSGHGFLDKQTQQPILCLKNTETNNLATTGLPVAEILQKLAKSGAKYQLIFIDACHSGGTSISFQDLSQGKKLSESETSSIAPQLIELFWQRAAKSKGFYALLSCDKYEQSEEWKNLKHGLFTYYLIQGFLGKAADKSGVIEADSLYKYVYHRTLEYIDKTNQQIRLTNQQKANRGESNIQSESPGQTPLRIVEGAGEFVLGIVPINSNENSRRQAVIINALAGCEETVSLSGVLHSRGEFVVGYWPRTDSSWQDVKAGILKCLNIDPPQPPLGRGESELEVEPPQPPLEVYPPQPPLERGESELKLETAFLYIRGEVESVVNNDNEQEHYLVLGDGVRISCFWLQRKLWNSQVRQQVIILDFPNAENNVLTEWVEYLHQEKNSSQCIIASSSLQFSQELVKILGNARHGLTVAGLVIELQQRLKITTYLSGNAIDVLLPGEATNTIFDANICPYKGLEAFRQQDAEFFFGRQKLIQEILARLRDSSFLAVVGASGSGKSSVVQAGVLPQLAAGKQLPGKCLCCCFRPSDFLSGKTEKTEKTLINALAQALATDGKVDEMEGLLHLGVQGLVLWLRRRVEPMVVLVVDQFEELFTLSGEKERLEFLNLLLGALRETSDKLRLIITLRDDFIGNCLEVPELEVLVQENLILVSPNLGEEEYREAIVKPAEKVGLKVESGLVDVLLDGVQEELGGLPLLQFVLRELWEKRRDGMLSLQVYQEEIGGFKEVLENKAEDVRGGLHGEEESCAQFIFLELVQLGEEGKDTRRRVLKSELLGKKYEKEVMESVLQKLSDARLIVVGGLSPLTPLCKEQGSLEGGGDFPESGDRSPLAPLNKGGTNEEEKAAVSQDTLPGATTPNSTPEDHNNKKAPLPKGGLGGSFSQESSPNATTPNSTPEDNNNKAPLPKGGLGGSLSQESSPNTTTPNSTSEDNNNKKAPLPKGGLGGSLSQESSPNTTTPNSTPKDNNNKAPLPKGGLGGSEITVEVAHEILIRHWTTLRWWLDKNRSRLQQQRQMEQDAKKWVQHGRVDDFLLRGVALQNAEELYIKYGDELSELTQEFIEAGMALRQRQEEEKRLGRRRTMLGLVSGLVAVSVFAVGAVWQWRSAVVEKRNATLKSEITSLESLVDTSLERQLDVIALGKKLKAGWVNLENRVRGMVLLQQTFDFEKWKEFNTLSGHKGRLNHVSLSPDGQLLASASSDRTVRLWQVDGTPVATLEGHKDDVYHVSFSPDGQLLASASSDRTVRLWQVDGTPVATLEEHKSPVFQVSFSPDGQLLASVSGDDTVRLWQLDGTPVATLDGHKDLVRYVSFSPDGQLLASSSEDGTVHLWQTDGTPVVTLEGHKDSVYHVSFSPDSKLLASASDDGTVRVWQTDGTHITTLDGQRDDTAVATWIYHVSFSPDGKLLASASSDHTVRLWQLHGTPVATLEGHKDDVYHVSFSPDGQLLASASDDGTVRIWQVDGTPVATLEGHKGSVYHVSFSPDGQLLASASDDGTMRIWQVDGTPVANLEGHKDSVYHVSFSPDSQLLVSASNDDTLRIWQTDGTSFKITTLESHNSSFLVSGKVKVRKTMFTFCGYKEIYCRGYGEQPIGWFPKRIFSFRQFGMSPDGKLFATRSNDGIVRVWQVDGTYVATLYGHKDSVYHVSFSPDGQLLASASDDGTVGVWQVNGTPVATLEGHKDHVFHVSFSPDGQLLASASGDGTVGVWQVDGTPVATLEGHKSSVFHVSFSPDGQLLASANGDGTVGVWQVDGTPVATLEGHKNAVYHVSFSPDGKLLASASYDGTVRVWQTDGTPVAILEEHKSPVYHVSFSRDGQLLASASDDSTVRLWQVDGTPVATLEGHKSSVWHLSFSPDGKLLASASDDGTVRLWNFDLDSLLKQGCDWVGDYLKNNPNVSEEDKRLCEGIE